MDIIYSEIILIGEVVWPFTKEKINGESNFK